ncbi:hypothetical protein GSD1FS_0727 [Bifidobacterium sp. GSD1FS]|uniref:Uncharacterized protein n=1 Tax=Bifidobacterium canis TaxID=2610880 RepID=A0A7K1J4N0_9BIFI|nr:hypothetical protein [Bifidobacterium canis]
MSRENNADVQSGKEAANTAVNGSGEPELKKSLKIAIFS